MKSLKTGYIVTGSSHFDPSYANATRRKSIELLNTLGTDILCPESIACDLDGLAPIVSDLKREGVGLLIVQAGSFSWDNLIAHIATQMPDVPLVLWAVREPPMDGGMLKVNSLCSIMMNGAACAKLGKEFRFIYGNPDDSRVRESLACTIRAAKALAQLRHTPRDIFGSRPPGFTG